MFYIIQDAAAGDSGAPLYSIGTLNNETGERTGETLIGIHSGGLGQSAFGQVLRLANNGKTFLAKWYARVSYFLLFGSTLLYLYLTKTTQKNYLAKVPNLIGILSDNCHTVFQVASFAEWIKCTQKNAVGGKLSQKGIKRACDKPDIEKRFPPKCEQKIFFETGKNENCK